MRSRLTILALSTTLMICGIGCRSATDKSAKPENSQAGSEPSQPENKAASTDSDKGGPGANTKGEVSNGSHYRINVSQSHFTANVGVGGLLSSLGHPHTIAIRDFSGEVQVTPATLQPASIHITIKANSLAEVGKEFNEKDRQEVNRAVHEQALEIAKYPEISFKSTSISVNKLAEGQFQAKITGNLTLHGITHPISFPAQVRLDGNSLRAQGEFSVLHSAYNMKQISAGGGTVKAKDEMKLSFNIVANKV